MQTFTEDMQLVELELFDAAFVVSPDAEDDVRRRFMTLFAAPSTRRRGGSSELVRVTNVRGEQFALKRLRVASASSSGQTPTGSSPRRQLRHSVGGSPSATPSGTPDYVTEGHVAAFWEEYRIHVALAHLRGFPKLYGFGLSQGNPVIVMEWVEGVTLREVTHERSVLLPLQVVASLGQSVLRILQRAGELDEGFVHRDLSPRNVMLRTDAMSAAEQLETGDFDLCLVDFGSASLKPGGLDPTFTQMSEVWRMGTPSYAPPEMLSSDIVLPEEYRHSEKIDVYALCSMLYELYCGHVPFEGVSRANGRSPYRIKTEEQPEELVPREPDAGALAAAIMAGLEARQEARPTVAQLQTAIANWQRLPSSKPVAPHADRSSREDGFWQPNYAERTLTRRKFLSVGMVAASAVACGLLVGSKLLGGGEPPLDKSRYTIATTVYDGEPLFKAYDADSRAWVLCSAAGEIVTSFASGRTCGALREGLVALFDDVSQRYGFVTPVPGADQGYAWVVLPAFLSAADFSEGLAAVQDPKSRLWGYVDASGAWAIEPRFAEASSFCEGAAAVRPNDSGLRWGAVDATGEWLVEPQFLALGSRDEGGFAVAEDASKPGTWGIVDADGAWTSDRRFHQLRRMCGGLAPALQKPDGAWGFVDVRGEWVVEPAFRDARPFYERQAAVQDPRTKLWYFVGPDGAPAHDAKPGLWKLGDLHDGLAPAQASAADDKVVFDESDPNTFVRGAGMRYGYVDASGTWQMRRLTRLVDAAINPPQL